MVVSNNKVTTLNGFESLSCVVQQICPAKLDTACTRNCYKMLRSWESHTSGRGSIKKTSRFVNSSRGVALWKFSDSLCPINRQW